MNIREASLILPDHGEPIFEEIYQPELLGGVVVLKTRGAVPAEDWGELYHTIDTPSPSYREVMLTAVPYFAWNNRGVGAMTVWLQNIPETALS